MVRTQIYLTAEETELLDRASQSSGATRSELIRRAIRHAYAGQDRSDRLASLQASAGVWRDRTFTGAAYVDALRGDLGSRLEQLGLSQE